MTCTFNHILKGCVEKTMAKVMLDLKILSFWLWVLIKFSVCLISRFQQIIKLLYNKVDVTITFA